MKRYITEQGVRYLIRGPHTATDLRGLFRGFLAKYPGTKITFAGWLVGYGKVYCRVRAKELKA